MTSSLTLHHDASHELALLESFVGERVQTLPKLATALPHQLPPRAAAYHTQCAAMLRDVLRALASLSPRLAQLVAQVWDLTSLNVFVLVQLAQMTLDDKDAATTKWRQLQRFGDETAAQYATRVAAYESELEAVRTDVRELRAELQTTRQRANRLGVENAQLRKAVHGLMDMNDSLHGRMETAVEKLDDAPLGAPASDAEERELYGVNAEDVEKLEVVHAIESYAQDFDQLFEGLVDRTREQQALLNELDRFMNSNVVSLLWRHGPDDDQTQFLQQMMSKRTNGTQTEDEALGVLRDELDIESESDGDDDVDGDDDPHGPTDGHGNSDGNYRHGRRHRRDQKEQQQQQHQHLLSGATGTATLVTKRQLLPPSLRAQLTTRPKIQRVLEKDQLSRVVLLLLVDKMERDGAALRSVEPQPRVPLHRFLKDFFLQRYGLVSLAEYRMMEVVKSVLYYHEKLEAEARRLRLITGSAVPPSAVGDLDAAAADDADADPASAFSLLPGLAALPPLSSDDLRIALFARLCELVPLQWHPSQVVPPAGNLFACATNALVDFLGDVIELDRTSNSLRDVVERPAANDWELPLDVASLLVTHHFAHCDAARLPRLQRRLRQLVDGNGTATTTASSLAPVPVDALLVFFATQWFETDQQLASKLHDTFHREAARQQQLQQQLHAYSTYSRDAATTTTTAPLETLTRVWRALPNEHVSLPELDELQRAFATILELRQSQQAQQAQQLHSVHRRISKRPSVVPGASSRPGSATPVVSSSTTASSSMGLCVGGISEKEFVFQSQQILRARRVCRGLRTNGRGISVVVAVAADADRTEGPLLSPPVVTVIGPRGRPLASAAAAVAVDELKPTG